MHCHILFGLLTLLSAQLAYSAPPPLHNQQPQTPLVDAQPTSFWLEQINHEGTSPFYSNDWKVFRNVKDYGAKGDGVTDDTVAIQAAINDGNRNNHPGGTTGTPALVYLPSGAYIVSGTLQLWLQTALVGNAQSKPVIKAANALGPNYLVNGNDYSTQSTNNFYVAIRSIILDTTSMDPTVKVKALNWGVSQATSLSDVDIVMPLGETAHTGIVMAGREGDNAGSNTMFGDLSITGGNVGVQVAGQQLLLKSIKFTGCRTAVNIQGHYLLVLQDLHFENCGTAIDDVTNPATGLYVIDSTAKNCGPAIQVPDRGDGSASIFVENFKILGGDNTAIQYGTNTVPGNITNWAHGNVYVDNTDDLTKNHVQRGIALSTTNRPSSLLRSDGSFYVKKMPLYENMDASNFASVKSFGAKGDGQADDTEAIVKALSANANSKVTYFPHGVYRVTSTITIPSGSRLVGEVWSVITGSGGFFGDASNPQPVLQLGANNSTGTAEISDLLVTIDDVLPGAILLEVNMAGVQPGDVSLHNTHFRIGGTKDSNVNNVCNRSPGQCKAGFLLLHATQSSSAYFEDMWGWTADHALEDGTQGGGQSTYISTGRGFLIESQKATWMMGVAPEHQTLYGLNINNARNVYVAMAQVETPYWQPNPPSAPNTLVPAPWTPNGTYGDPDFANCAGTSDDDCYKAWGMRVSGGAGILVYGVGTWTFFENFNGDWNGGYDACSKGQGTYCQENAYEIQNNPSQSYFYGLATSRIRNMVVTGLGDGAGQKILARENENPGGWGGHIVAYLGFSGN